MLPPSNAKKIAFPLHLLRHSILSCSEKELSALALSVPKGDCLEIRILVYCRNLSPSSTLFIMDPQCITCAIAYRDIFRYIPIIVHSHKWTATPSKHDIESMRIWRTVWVIISQCSGVARAWLYEHGKVKELKVLYTSCDNSH